MANSHCPRGWWGWSRSNELLGRHVPASWADLDPAEAAGNVVVGIETDRGPWVAALVAAGYRVYAIDPTSAARYRQRHSMSGAKADSTDAHLLTEIVRVDRTHHRPVAGDSAEGAGRQGGAERRMSSTVRAVLERYPRAPQGRTRVAELMRRLDSLVRDPAPEPERVIDAGPFFHGTRADLFPGDLLTPGWDTSYGSGKRSRHIYLTSSASLSMAHSSRPRWRRDPGTPRVYRVEPLGPIYDDPNVTDKKFPGNPTRSYRTKDALRIVAEVIDFAEPEPALVDRIRTNTAELRRFGIEAIDD